LDNISVVAVSPPLFQATALAGGAFAFTWTALPGMTYQVQYTTNLAAPVWNNLGGAITATKTVLSSSDAQPPDQQRFYRVILLP
jgi:hypothetical protein